MAETSRLFIQGCWALLLVCWVITGLAAKKTTERKGWFGYRVVIALVALVAIAVIRLAGAAPLDTLWRPGPAAAAAIDALIVLGLALSVWARIALGRNWSADPTFKQDHELIITGPYSLVRHPIYTGLLTMCTATMLIYGRALGIALLIALTAGLWWKSRREEEIMREHFRDAYAAYARRVPAFIPLLPHIAARRRRT